ncbi:unnamed protein product [Peniophora sp. CBMAI 1063]|nr:unnamed protein product [Peniophora sp. CBMAI 1063]
MTNQTFIHPPTHTPAGVTFTGPIGADTNLMMHMHDDTMATFDGMPAPPPPSHEDYDDEIDPAARNTNVEQLREFARGKTAIRYAHCVIERRGPPPPSLVCNECGVAGTARWRCDSCQRHRDLCTGCLRKRHMSNPFHRVRYLSGPKYVEAWLRDAGVFIQLCPVASGDDLCPGYTQGEFPLPAGIDKDPPPSYGIGHRFGRPENAEQPTNFPDTASPDTASPDVASGGSPFMSQDPDEDLLPSDARETEGDEGDADGQENGGEDGFMGRDEGLPEGEARARGRQARIRRDTRGLPVMVIVDKTDIHQIGVAVCKCAGTGASMAIDEQLIRLGGLIPATPSNPGTCFTLEALSYFQIDRLECKVTPQALMRRLRRNTSPLHPSTVAVCPRTICARYNIVNIQQDRYLEGLRVMREWTVIDNLITHGFAHQPLENWQPPPPGSLFHRCVVCASKKNLPRGYKGHIHKWAIFHSYVHDGNFSGEHTVSRQPGNNVPIFPGTGAFQHPEGIKRDLASMKTDKQLRKEAEHLFANDKPCNNHVAAQLTGKTRDKVTDIKGIGAWACARHGQFLAGGTCNYNLGEASGPADVALNNTFKLNTDVELVDRLQLFYDIWCRYGIHLKERFNRSPNMTWPQFREVLGSVGVWHIYGHVFECYGRWSNLYSRQTGIVDGEILETLWSVLNQILQSCRGMSLANREEVISMFESDSNHRKNLAMADTLVKKFNKYFAEERERARLVEQLSLCTSPENVVQWEEDRQAFERDRINDPSAGDRFFKQTLVQVPSRKDAELKLLEEEAAGSEGRGLVKAVIDSLDLVVDQLKLQALDRQAVAASERRNIASTRTKIHNRVNKCNAAMEAALGSYRGHGTLTTVKLTKLLQEDEWDDTEEAQPGAASRRGDDAPAGSRVLRTGAEFRAVDLPSSRSSNWRAMHVNPTDDDDCDIRRHAMEIETGVLLARMNETLGHIRTLIVDQANTYLQRIRSRNGNGNQGYHQLNVAYADAQKQGKAVRVHAQIYNICREKLMSLAWDTSPETKVRFDMMREKYRVLTAKDLVCSTKTYSTTGTVSGFKLPWFWRMVGMDATESVEQTRQKDEEFIADFFRVRWINAKCSLTRCREELIILTFEMQMCYLGYRSLASGWMRKAKNMAGKRAHEAMAFENAGHWSDMAAYAKARFNECHENVIPPGLKTEYL